MSGCVGGGGVIQKHRSFFHLTIPISLHVLQAVVVSTMAQLSGCHIRTSVSHDVVSSIPTSDTAKQNQKNGGVPHPKFLGVIKFIKQHNP